MSRRQPRSNCLLWALLTWRRRGGYLWIRRSTHWWGPHFGWTAGPGRPMLSYSPREPKDGPSCPPPLFRGRVRRER